MLIDALHPQLCTELPIPGTRITIPGEEMTILSQDESRVTFHVIRDPFEIPNYEMQPAHGHIHPNQAEGFEVIEGRAAFIIGDERLVLGPGEVGIVPPNTIHHWMALDDKPVTVRAYFEPALDISAWFLYFQHHIANDSIDLLQAAVISREFSASSPVPVEPPAWVWNIVSRILAPIGRLSGYQACSLS